MKQRFIQKMYLRKWVLFVIITKLTCEKEIGKCFDNECQLDLPMICSTTVYLVAESA
jgi:hypothetical protein